MAFPTLLRFRDLKPKKVIENRPTLQRRIQYDGFAPGCLLGKNTRVWTENEIGAWLETRSASRTAPSRPMAILGARMSVLPPRLLTTQEAAAYLQVSTSYLAKARLAGNGPRYRKFGRSVRYTEADLMDWVRSRARTSTSEHHDR